MRPVALILALTITAIAGVDPLYCSDGCTRTDIAGATRTAPPTGADCPICQPGSLPLTTNLPDASLTVASAVTSLELSVVDYISPSIERPPRT